LKGRLFTTDNCQKTTIPNYHIYTRIAREQACLLWDLKIGSDLGGARDAATIINGQHKGVFCAILWDKKSDCACFPSFTRGDRLRKGIIFRSSSGGTVRRQAESISYGLIKVTTCWCTVHFEGKDNIGHVFVRLIPLSAELPGSGSERPVKTSPIDKLIECHRSWLILAYIGTTGERDRYLMFVRVAQA
jgi:hypothetical protein